MNGSNINSGSARVKTLLWSLSVFFSVSCCCISASATNVQSRRVYIRTDDGAASRYICVCVCVCE